MSNLSIILLIVAVALLIGIAFVQVRYNKIKQEWAKAEKEQAEKDGLIRKEALIQAKEALQAEREKINEDERERRRELNNLENKLTRREDTLENKIQEVVDKESQLDKKEEELEQKENYLAETIQKQITELERIAGMSREDAKNMLLDQLKHDLAQEQMQLIRENEAKIKEDALEKSKEILSTTMQRCMMDQVVESTVAVVSLPNDEMKGRIIGREGRNIRTLETRSEAHV